VVLRDGVVEQEGEPLELYARPRNLFVAGFLGAPQMNFLKGTARRAGGDAAVVLEDGSAISLPAARLPFGDGAPVTLGIRPEHVAPGSSAVRVKVENTEVLGSETIVHTRLGSGKALTYSRRGIAGAKPGDLVPLDFPPAFVHVFDEAGNAVGTSPDWRSDYID
jgi:multiple sugar transport system ATP-binding protein